jgi:periplasmic protein TonB
MSYKALLFSSDDATARVIAQVLGELEFQSEPHKEPFAAVKALTSNQVDAMVVDCANEQDAALLVKSARNSSSNQQALFIAIVDGKSGVTSAFRLGANLVLTKPVSLEQAKNTLRMARGLLQKNVAKTAAPATAPEAKPAVSVPKIDAPIATPVISAPVMASPVAASPVAPAASAAAPAPAVAKAPVIPPAWSPSTQVAVPSAAILETEKESGPSLEPADAGLLESLQEVVTPKPPAQPAAPAMSAKKEFPWQKAGQSSTGEAAAVGEKEAEPSAPKFAFKAPVKSEAPAAANVTPAGTAKPFAPRPLSIGTVGQAAAAAPARVTEPEEAATVEEVSAPEVEEKPAVSEAHTEPAAIAQPKAKAEESGGRKWLLVAAGVVAIGATGYVGWTKFLSAPATAPAHVAAPVAVAPAVTEPAATLQTTPAMPSPAVGQGKSQLIASTASAPANVKPVVSAPRSMGAAPVLSSAEPNPDVLVVTNQPATPPPAPKPVVAEPVAAPPNVMEVTAGSGSSAISSVVSGASTATPTLVTGPVSQGVAQGMLIKRVQPVYPPQARAMHLGGPVTLGATIAKDGSVKNLKQVSGDPTLGKAAIDAVSQWKYSPYLLDGQPVDTPTQITVNFKAQ